MTRHELLQQVLQHPTVAAKLTGRRTPEGAEIAWCTFHPDGKGKPPHQPNLHISERGYHCHACKARGSLRDLARHLGIEPYCTTKQPVATWHYYSPDGSRRLYRKCRFESSAGKTYALRRRAPEGWRECKRRAECQKEKRDCYDGWVWSLQTKPCSPAPPLVLYNQPLLTLVPDEPVYLVEGEKCADSLWELDLVAVCNPHGAGEWKPQYSDPLGGREARILVDADEAGRGHGQLVSRSLWGKARSLTIVDLYQDRDDGSDIADWIAERGRAGLDDDTIRVELEALVAQAPEWGPSRDDSAAGLPIPAPSEANPAEPIFLTPAQLASGNNAREVDWLWEGFLAPGHITLLAGKPRASGKSTFALGVIRAMLSGEAFLGFTTRPVKAVVFLSEETALTLLDKIALFHLSQYRQLLVAPRHATARLTWEEAVAEAVAEAKRVGAGLLVVDSFPHFAKLPKDGAKDASLINEAFCPLQAAAAEGLAVLLIHHERRGEGEAGEGVRDSGAIVASSDIILELGRAAVDRPSVRKVELLSPFRATPSDFVLDFDKDSGEYTYLGTLEDFQDSQKEVEREAAARKIAALLPEATGLTHKEVAEKASLGKSQVGELLNKAVRMGLAARTGRGAKNDPYRYHRVDGSGLGKARGSRQRPAPASLGGLPQARTATRMFPPMLLCIGTGGNKSRTAAASHPHALHVHREPEEHTAARASCRCHHRGEGGDMARRGNQKPRRSWMSPRGCPHIRTRIVGFTQEEWQTIRLAAATLFVGQADAVTLISPDRPELYRLGDKGDRYELRLSSEQELAATLREEMGR